jgi:hypothetical protein
MARLPLSLGFDFYRDTETLSFSAQRCINWVPVVAESEALNNRMLMQPSGLKVVADTLLGANRGGMAVNEIPYFVNGNSLVEVSESGTFINRGTIPGAGRVSMAVNGKNVDTGAQLLVVLVPGVGGYVYDTNLQTVTQITDPDFRVSDTVVFKDGFFVFSSSDGTVFFNSALNDPFTYDAVDFGTAEINPDKVVALHVNHNELFVCGFETIELFQNIGGPGFPFQRIPGANIQKGVHAKFSLLEFDNTFVFAGGGLNEKTAIWKVTGSSSVVKISTNAIDSEIQRFNEEEISNSFGMTYAEKGQFLAVFTFESTRIPSKTFVYNGTASALLGKSVWFEFQSGVNDNRFRVQSIVRAYGKLLVGDSEGGIIGELDRETLDYYGDNIFIQSSSSPFSQNGVKLFAGLFEATFQAGVGLTGEGDPLVRLDFSDDGGRTFSSETRRGIGKIGQYGQRAVWERQGSFPVSRVIRLTITDKVRANLVRLAAEPELGTR